MDEKRIEESIRGFEKFYRKDIEQEYLNFSRFIQGLFISPDGWILDTGDYRTVNRALIKDIYCKIRKHPLIWKIFFRVA